MIRHMYYRLNREEVTVFHGRRFPDLWITHKNIVLDKQFVDDAVLISEVLP